MRYFTLIPRNHNEYQTTQNRSCLIYQEHEVELSFYSLLIDSLTPLIIFFSHYHNEIKNHMCLFIYLSKSIIFRTDIYIPVIQNCFIRIGGRGGPATKMGRRYIAQVADTALNTNLTLPYLTLQINFNVLNSIRSRYL